MRYSDTLRSLSMVLSEVPDQSIAICLHEASEKIDMYEKTSENNKLAIKSINEALLVIKKLQDKATNPSGTDQSMHWHDYAKINLELKSALYNLR